MCIGDVRAIAFCLALSVAAASCGAREPEPASQGAGPGAPTPSPPPSVPADWQRVTVHGLAIPVPPGWTKTLDTFGKSDRPDPEPPQILAFEEKGAASAAARQLPIWIWPSSSVDELVRTRFVKGNLSFISQAVVPARRPTRELIGSATWSDGAARGSYRARHLFVQVDAERVVDVIVLGPRVPSTESEPTPEMRLVQEIVAAHLEALPAASCPRTRTTDGSAFTADRAVGILDRTDASATEVNDAFLMVRRDGVVGDRANVEFVQIGTSGPARSVTYGVGAERHLSCPLCVRAPWGDAVFKLGVKPIAFADSCWRLFVDGADSGIVLQIGP